MKLLQLSVWAIFAFLLTACDGQNVVTQKGEGEPEPIENGLVKQYSKTGKLRAEINFKDKKKHGLAKSYFPNGKVAIEMYYNMGVKDSLYKRFYESGSLYEECTFKNNLNDGLKKMYYDGGKPMSQQTFKAGVPCADLKEYTKEGKLKEQYPELVFKIEDKTAFEDYGRVVISLSDKSKKVEYFRGKIGDNPCDFELEPLPTYDGESDLRIDMPKGTFFMKEMFVVAKVKTKLGNYKYITGKKNIAFENR